jgi:ABC-type protease/lipase transport system fused ATPase/permease subunit
MRQKTLSFITEGIVFSGFLVIGGYLVIEGHLPVGEFIAAEIIVVSITYAIKGFVKKLDYIYDTIEGFYKVDKLSEAVGANV